MEKLTVTELIKCLQRACREAGVSPDEAIPQYSYNYGDYWNTQVAAPVERVEGRLVERSERLMMDSVVDEDRLDREDIADRKERGKYRTVIIMS